MTAAPARVALGFALFLIAATSMAVATSRLNVLPNSKATLPIGSSRPTGFGEAGAAPSVIRSLTRRDVPQGHVTAVSDSSTGTATGSVVSCVDIRSGAPFDYLAQHVLSDGRLDTSWSAASSPICLGTRDGLHQVLSRDVTGGAFAGWVDARPGDPDIYLQHFDANGAVAAGWPADGLPVCQAAYAQYNLDMAADGSGGVFMAWQDFRNKRAGDIYAQHITSTGAPASGWPLDGLAICSDSAEQSCPRIVSDGSDGAYAVWQDRRGGHLALYGQHIQPTGVPGSGWPATGAPLTDASGEETLPAIVCDATGTLRVVWRTEGSGTAGVRELQIGPGYVPSPGQLPAAYVLSEGATAVGAPAISAAVGGMKLVGWTEWRQEVSTLRVQRLLASGQPDPGWPSGGAVATQSPLGRNAPSLVAEADSGVVVAWEDYRSGSSDVYSQRVSGAGLISPGWAVNGLPVATGSAEQFAPSITADGSGGVVATWADAATSTRAGVLLAHASSGKLATLKAATTRPGHAHIVWQLAPELAGKLTAYRMVGETGDWVVLCAVVPNDSNCVVLDDHAAPEGESVQYRLALSGENYIQYLEAVALQIPVSPLRLALHRAWALPAQNVIVLSLALPRGNAPQVDMYDVMGRHLQRQTFPGLEPGEQTVRMSVSGRLPSGVFFLRLEQGSEARSAKVVFIR